MTDDPDTSASSDSSTDHLSLVDAAYEVALDPERYDELVEQWHKELTEASDFSAQNLPETGKNSPEADHFQRASTILERVHRSDWKATTERSEPAQVAMPEVLLSRSGTILRANFGATALLSARVGEPLTTLDIAPAAQESLLERCRNTSARPNKDKDKARSDLLRIARSGDDRPLVVMLNSTTFENKDALALRCAEIVWPETLAPLLVRAFDLTSAECQIVQSMVAGHNTAAIASSRGTSKETVRTQIRQLLAKTGTHSQLELIRITIGFSMMSQQAEARAGKLPAAQAPAQPPAHNDQLSTNALQEPHAKSSIHRLLNGTDFELVQYGPDTGQPVLVFHDEVIGDGFVPPLFRQAPGYRWLIAVRRGFGSTSLQLEDKNAEENRQTEAEVFDEVLSALNSELPAAPVLAHGNGIFFATAFAQKYPQRCTSITALVASLPGDSSVENSNRYTAFMKGMSRRAPAMLRFAIQAGFAMYARVGAQRFLQQVYGESEADNRIINSPECMKDLEHGGRLTLAQGYRGFFYDELALVADWSEQFLATPVPVCIMIGDQDQEARRVRAERLCRASNTVELVELENTGFFAAFSATKTITDRLLSL